MSGANPPIVGVVLAGGLGTRMGAGDKPLRDLAGRSMVARVVDRLRPQADTLIINANGDPSRFSGFGLPIVPDSIPGFAGPLAGILAGMRWAQDHASEARFLVSVPSDTPFFPPNLVTALSEGCGRDEDTIAMAASPDGTHPVFALWPIALADDLERYMAAGGTKIITFADRHLRLNVPFENLLLDGIGEVDPFFNVNTPEEAVEAEEIARRLDAVRG
jgi:molybdenum cofactor guanylyltransferase